MKSPTCQDCPLKATNDCSFHTLVASETTCSAHPGWVTYIAETVEEEERNGLVLSEASHE